MSTLSEKETESLELAVSAIYFADNSDYLSTLYEIVRCIGGDKMANKLYSSPSKVYKKYVRLKVNENT